MKNPKWQRDELILALELFFRTKPGEIHARNSEIIELSELLNKLPIHSGKSRDQKFRNPNGVGLKLSNFLSLDPSYEGKGMSSTSRLDKEVFGEFYDDRKRLAELASRLRDVVLDETLSSKLYEIEEDADDMGPVAKEGKVLYKLHKHRERDQKLVKLKKKQAKKEKGALLCEVCNFDFSSFYGSLGEDFIECHHLSPLFESGTETETTLDDLALVCANCHRMLHRGINTIGIDELREIIERKNISNIESRNLDT